MDIRLSIDTRTLVAKQRRLARFFKVDFLRVFKRFRVYMLRQTSNTFRTLRRGGRFRGVTWQWYADQYTRKTDGVTVPAQGRVRKVRGVGLVKGRLRPSGKRVTSASNLMRDTGRLSAAAGQTVSFRNHGKTLRLGTNVSYAGAQQRLRPYLFFQVPEDELVLRDLFIEELQKAITGKAAGAGRAGGA